MTSSTTHFSHRVYCLSPSSGDHSLPSPNDLVPIELHLEEMSGSSSSHKLERRVTKTVTWIPLSDITCEEHLVSMSLGLYDLGIPKQNHPKIIADTCCLLKSIVAATPPLIVVKASAFTWTLRALDHGFLGADSFLPGSSSLAHLGFCC